MNQSPSTRTSTWDVFFSYGFRPFFLGASLYAALAMALWLAWIAIHAANASLTWLSISGAPHVWHAHEMVFGFGLSAVAGFLLTAVPNWTGAQPLSGSPLARLFAIWIAGRVVMMLSAMIPPSLVAVVDLAFIPALGLHVTHQLFVRPQARNMVFLALLGALFLANVAYHLTAADVIALDQTAALRAAVLTLVLIIVIIGGRVVPAFTHNHLLRAKPNVPPPVRSPIIDKAALGTTILFAICAIAPVPGPVLATTAGAAALANAIRLAGWRGLHALNPPIVGVLHIGYVWIVVGLALWCLAAATGLVSEIAALHALTSGAVGTMVLAVMSRASLGHTGRPLVAPPSIAMAYGLVSLAALLRTFGPALAPSWYNAIMLSAGLLWIAAFTTFAAVFLPILTSPRPPPATRPA